MNKNYNLKFDLNLYSSNPTMRFGLYDNDTSDFKITLTEDNKKINISNSLIILGVINPSGNVDAQFLEVTDDHEVYGCLKPSMKSIPGVYTGQILLINNAKRIATDTFEYTVDANKIISMLNVESSKEERFTILTDMLSRLSVVENSENLRVENENNRLEAEKLREEAIEKIKSDTTKLISDTKKEIADYKNTKDTAINDDLSKYKEATTQSIEEYKGAKDTEINNTLREYKTNTTKDIEEFKNTKSQELDNFKNTKNTELDNYKREKDLAINQYVESKNLEINDYVAAKNRELDEYKGIEERRLALFTTSTSGFYNGHLQIGAIVNMTNGNGLVLEDSRNGNWCSVQVNVDSSGRKFFRPLENGNTELGSLNYRWKNVFATNTYSTQGIVLSNTEQFIDNRNIGDNDIIDNINFIEPLRRGSDASLVMDVTNIQNTPYVKVSDEGEAYMNDTEMIKLLLKEVKQLKEEIRLLKGEVQK